MAESRRGLERLSDRALKAMFWTQLEIAQGKLSWVDRLSNFFTSDSDKEEYPDLDGAPVLAEQMNGDNYKSLTPDSLIIENIEFQAGIKVNKKYLRRDKTMLIEQRLSDLATRSVTHWATLLTNLIKNGESTAIGNGSGENYFSASHAFRMGGTYSNLLTASDYSELNVATAANPTADEFAKALLKVIQHLYSYTDAEGEPVNDDAEEFVCMVPINMLGAATEAVSSRQLETGSGSRDNVLGNFNVSVAPNARLTSTTEFYVFRSDASMKPLIRQSEVDVELTYLGPDSEYCATHNGDTLTKIEAVRNAGYGHWWEAEKATLS